ncbi:MAG: hypothetical protein M0036_25745 [Desulfobacteraceae bacterium]|nr:hypothetical protein [Desulfobacteraceae bacterium]
MNKRDLFVVVADLDAENTFKTLFAKRQQALGIRVNFDPAKDLLRYSGRDAGCCKDAVNLLRAPQSSHRHALLCFDHHGSGLDQRPRIELEAEIESRLYANGWPKADAAVIIIDPELEAWVWADSRQVASVLGWSGNMRSLRAYLEEAYAWPALISKPPDPKRAFELALRQVRKPRVATLFKELAEKVSLSRCQDASFQKLRSILRQWFAHEDSQR